MMYGFKKRQNQTSKRRGFKLIFNTEKSFFECERVLDDAISKLSDATRMDFCLDMKDDEVKAEIEKLFS